MKRWRYTATFEVIGTFSTADAYDEDDAYDEAVEHAHMQFSFGNYTDLIEVEAVQIEDPHAV